MRTSLLHQVGATPPQKGSGIRPDFFEFEELTVFQLLE
jgi:hypothetical protein